MDGLKARLINGSLVLSASLVVFISAKFLLDSGAVGVEDKVAALFLLINPLIILAGFSFGAAVNFAYLSAVLFLLYRFVYIYGISSIFRLSYSFILISVISYFLSRKIYSNIKSYKREFSNAEDRFERINNILDENKKIKLALENKLERFSSLKAVIEELSTTLTLGEVAGFAADRIYEIIPKAETALVYFVDEFEKLTIASLKTKLTNLSPDQARADIFDRWMLRSPGPLIVSDVRKDFRFGASGLEEVKRDIRSLISAPLISENKISGILRLESHNPEEFSPDDLRILSIFSDLVAVAAENALLYRQMEELSKKDGLTGLFIPRYFYAQLESLIERQRGAKIISLLMLDIDYFKEYNDRHGHIAGDLLLKQIAGKLVADIGNDDFAVRYGGEEFAIVLIGVGLQEAVKRAEFIRKEIADNIFMLRRQETKVTVSIGIATYPNDGRTKEELIHKADEWLYYAKEKGRNRIAYAGIK